MLDGDFVVAGFNSFDGELSFLVAVGFLGLFAVECDSGFVEGRLLVPESARDLVCVVVQERQERQDEQGERE